MLPINLVIPIITYTCWLVPLAITTYIPREAECFLHPGHTYYRIGITWIFTCFCVQVGTEILTVLFALQGNPLQTKKRWLAERLLLITYLVNVVQLAATIFGTWTLSRYPSAPCREDKPLRPFVISSWILLALSLSWTLLCLRWFPNQEGSVEAWVKRLRCVCYVCACLGFQSALEPLRKLDKEEGDAADSSKREEALVEHLAETFHVLFGDVNFTASDRHAALVLATALQQKRRHDQIRARLLGEGKLQEAGMREQEVFTQEEKELSRALGHDKPQQWPIVTPSNFAKKIRPDMGAQAAADRYTGFSEHVGQDELEEALGYFEFAVAAYYVQDQGLTVGDDESEKEKPGSDDKSSSGQERTEPEPEPGSQIERPMGDDPPPKNEELADQPAPTFMEYPDPHSDQMLATSAMAAAGGMARKPSQLSVVHENGLCDADGIPSTPTSPDLSPDDRRLLSQQSRGSPSPQPPEGEPQKSAAEEGEPADPRPKEDAAGNRVTAIDIASEAPKASGEAGEPLKKRGKGGELASEGGEPAGVGSRAFGAIAGAVNSTVKGIAGAVRGPAEKQDVEAGRSPSNDDDPSSKEPGMPSLSKPVSKMEGVDKTAEKAVKGEMQIGSSKAKQRKTAEAGDAVQEGEEGKVESTRCGFCTSSKSVVTPLDSLDCIYSRADNTILGTLPYMIALDWERRAIVLGVRGTSSLSDALTDAIAQPIPILPWLGDVVTEPDGGIASVHSGILACAAAVNHDLEDHGILSALLTGAAVDEEAKEAHTKAADLSQGPTNAALAAVLAKSEIGPFAALAGSTVEAGKAAKAAADVTEGKAAVEADPPSAGTPPEPEAAAASPSEGRSPFARPSFQMPRDSFQAPRDSLASDRPPAEDVAKQGRVLRRSQQLMLQDEDVIQQCLGVQQAEKQKNLDARRAWQARQKHPNRHQPKARGFKTQVSDEMAPEERRVQSSIAMQRLPSEGSQLRPAGSPAQPLGEQTAGNSVDRPSRERQKSRSPFMGKSRRASSMTLEAISPPKSALKKTSEAAELRKPSGEDENADADPARPVARPEGLGGVPAVLNVAAPPKPSKPPPGRSPPKKSPSGRKPSDPAAALGDDAGRKSTAAGEEHRRRRFSIGGDRRKSLAGGPSGRRRPPQEGMDRAGSTFIPEAFAGAGRAMRRLYSSHPPRDSEGQEQGSPRKKPQRGRQSVDHRLEEMVRNVETQMKKTFLPKIFKAEEDLRKLEQVALAEEQQRRRAEYRTKQLAALEERKLDCRGWQLVLTGHSLGAGVAALLALKLRPRFPNTAIKCWAYCPPGGLVSLGLSNAMSTFCTSVIVGKDGVPRASLGNLSRLVDEVVSALARGRRCKTRVLIRNVTARGRAKFRRPGEFHSIDQLPDQCWEVLEEYGEGAQRRKEAIGPAVFPPGRVMYCRRLKESSLKTSYDAVWLPPEEIMREGFIISSKMLKDHLCDSVTTALEASIERWKKPEEKRLSASADQVETEPDSSDVDTDEE